MKNKCFICDKQIKGQNFYFIHSEDWKTIAVIGSSCEKRINRTSGTDINGIRFFFGNLKKDANGFYGESMHITQPQPEVNP